MTIPRKYRKFIRIFSSAMVTMLSMLGYAFVLAALFVALAPDDGLKTEAPIPVWVIISMWWVGIGLMYLWISERLKVKL